MVSLHRCEECKAQVGKYLEEAQFTKKQNECLDLDKFDSAKEDLIGLFLEALNYANPGLWSHWCTQGRLIRMYTRCFEKKTPTDNDEEADAVAIYEFVFQRCHMFKPEFKRLTNSLLSTMQEMCLFRGGQPKGMYLSFLGKLVTDCIKVIPPNHEYHKKYLPLQEPVRYIQPMEPIDVTRLRIRIPAIRQEDLATPCSS